MTQPINIKTRDDSNIMNNPASYGSLDNMRGGRRSMSDTSAFRNSSVYFRSASNDLSNYKKRRKRGFMVGLGEDLTGILESQQIRENYETNSFKLQQDSEKSLAGIDDDGESGRAGSVTTLRSFRKLEAERISIQRVDLLLFFILGIAEQTLLELENNNDQSNKVIVNKLHEKKGNSNNTTTILEKMPPKTIQDFKKKNIEVDNDDGIVDEKEEDDHSHRIQLLHHDSDIELEHEVHV